MYLKHMWYNIHTVLVATDETQLSLVIGKNNHHHVMVELEKYINTVKRVILWYLLVIAPYEIHNIPIDKQMEEK